MSQYQINLSERQLQVYVEAMEFYSRFLSGQVTALPTVLEYNLNFVEVRDLAEEHLEAFKALAFPDLLPGQYYSIGWGEERIAQERQIAYEMYREVYVQRLRENPEEWSCYNSPTLQFSEQPLPVVNKLMP